MKFLLPLLAASLLMLGVSRTSAPETQFQADQRIAKEIFTAACSISKYNCNGLTVPQIRRTPEIARLGMRGLYFGGNVVFLAGWLMPVQSRLTAFHEMIHVLQWYSYPIFLEASQRCVMEREALNYTNAYARSLDLPENFIRTLDAWRKLYGCD